MCKQTPNLKHHNYISFILSSLPFPLAQNCSGNSQLIWKLRFTSDTTATTNLPVEHACRAENTREGTARRRERILSIVPFYN